MKEVISRKNVTMFVKGRYGISVDEWFTSKQKNPENPEFFETVMQDVFEEFTSAVEGNQLDLETLNPYTQKMEVFCQKEIGAIESFDELMETLSNTHKERMKHLSHSFYQELGIDKKEIAPKPRYENRTNELKSRTQEEQENDEPKR